MASASSCRSDPIGQPIQHSPSPLFPEQQHQHRVYYLPSRVSNKSKTNGRQQQQQKMSQRSRMANNVSNGGSGARANGVAAARPHYNNKHNQHRSSPRSNSSSNGHHHFYDPPYHYQHQAESRPLTANTSFHSESFYPDWSAHPQHIRLPYPSPETSFDQM